MSLTAICVPFSYRDGDDPGVTLHPSFVAFVDAELQGVVTRRTACSTCETDVPRFIVGGVDGRGADACLHQYGIDVGLLQFVEDVGEFPLLCGGSVGARPVESADGGYPDGSDLVFRHLGGCVLQ